MNTSWYWTPPSPKLYILTFPALLLWSSVSELSEMLLSRLQASFCLQLKLNSHVAHIFRRHSVQFSSAAQLCPILCDPMNRSTLGLHVHHQLPEFTQTHVHRVGDPAISSSVIPFSSCPQSLPASSIRVFFNESAPRMRWPKYWSFSFSISPSNEYSGLIPFRMDL